MEMWEPWKKNPQKTNSTHGNVEGGYPNCCRARDVIRPGEVVSSGPPVSTLEPTTFLLWGSSNSQMDKTLQNTYSQTWSWQQHAAGTVVLWQDHTDGRMDGEKYSENFSSRVPHISHFRNSRMWKESSVFKKFWTAALLCADAFLKG